MCPHIFIPFTQNSVYFVVRVWLAHSTAPHYLDGKHNVILGLCAGFWRCFEYNYLQNVVHYYSLILKE